MDDEAGGINNGESVIHVVTYMMMMISSYIPGCMGGYYSLFAKFQIFVAFLRFLLNFYSFSNGQKARKLRSATFFIITTCKRRFFSDKKKTQKNRFWALRHVSMAIVTIKDNNMIICDSVFLSSIGTVSNECNRELQGRQE